MQKAKPYPPSDADNERTNLESPWDDDEGSTTIEQSEANKRKADKHLGASPPLSHNHNTNHTHTGTGVDEPTVDDRHAPALSAITPVRVEHDARLLITQGNDAGQTVDILPGKTYTVGRALDNDVVLTDIAVSRKHFDLKFEDGAWIIVDRGSGNGTVVNGNVEDSPFMLASGDTIEIGNTVFKFDQPNGPPRVSQRTFDLEDEEMSTVAGKPLRESEAQLLPPEPPRARPKTMPPPVPPMPPPAAMRPATASAPPPPGAFQRHEPPQQSPRGGFSPRNEPPAPLALGAFPPRSGPTPFQQGEPQTPFSQPAFGQPLPASTLPLPQMANRPPTAGPPLGPSRSPTMIGDAMGMPMHLAMDPASPAASLASTIPHLPQQPPYGYPQANDSLQHSLHPHMLQVQSSQGRRPDGSTAHVAPHPYDPMLAMPLRHRDTGGAKRTKLAIAGFGLALLAGIVTAAIVKSSTSKGKAGTTAKQSASASADAKGTKPASKGTASSGATQAIVSTPIETPKTDAQKAAEAVKAADAQKLIAAQKAAEAVKAADAQRAADAAAKKQADADAAARRQADADAARRASADRKAAQLAARAEATRKAEEARAARAEAKRQQADRRRQRTTESSTKRVAAASDSSGARDRADALYRDRQFSEAASVLAAAAKSSGDNELRDRSSKLRALGGAYAKGTAPAQKPTTAFAALTQAINLDSSVGGNFKSELTDKLATVAPKAAVAFIAQKDYGNARSAYLAAQRAGSNDSNLALVKQKLESVANDLYAAASAEASSNPGPAKEKLKQVRTLVDAKSPVAVKAQALYNKL